MARKLTDTTEMLANWIALNKHIQLLSEAECVALLKKEKQGKARVQFLLRIHSRFNVLRAERERKELMGG